MSNEISTIDSRQNERLTALETGQNTVAQNQEKHEEECFKFRQAVTDKFMSLGNRVGRVEGKQDMIIWLLGLGLPAVGVVANLEHVIGWIVGS